MNIKRFYQINEHDINERGIKRIFRKKMKSFIENNFTLSDFDGDDSYLTFILYDVSNSNFDIEKYNGIKYVVLGKEVYYGVTETHVLIFIPGKEAFEAPTSVTEILDIMSYDSDYDFSISFRQVDIFGKDEIENMITPTSIAKKVNK